MSYQTLDLQGNILAPDILDKIQNSEITGQHAIDFGLEGNVREEIQFQYSQAKRQWDIFQHYLAHRKVSETATSETRKHWMLPFFENLAYEIQRGKSEQLFGKIFAISHRAGNRGMLPIHIVGVNDELDKKRESGGTRVSPHALVQEYLNLHEQLYGLITNGRKIRLLRDSGKLVRLSYVEFDLENMMSGEHLVEFGLMYRLIHSSRMPLSPDHNEESLIESYHLESLESGERIREGLSQSVRECIELIANGFLTHPANTALRAFIQEGTRAEKAFYQALLKLMYRLIFLMVIEERHLIYTSEAEERLTHLYYDYYSLSRLRQLSEKRYLTDPHHTDLWIALKHTFRLFGSGPYGNILDIKPLNGQLFGEGELSILNPCRLSNAALLGCIRKLNEFQHKDTGQIIRVNYGMLNVEEFGSVYENLLGLEPDITFSGSKPIFSFRKGKERSSSGSHYTPDELVKPLIQHSLDHLIEEKKELAEDPEAQAKALLSLKVCDVSCGSGHILLAAARRIGEELAKVRTNEEQPGPTFLRQATREVIHSCIYGVDKNPMAVELCKIALWLEAHVPGQPLSFLDHKIKCGDAVLGLGHVDKLQKGIANEAFKTLPGDDKELAARLRKRNRKEIKERGQLRLDFEDQHTSQLNQLSKIYRKVDQIPQTTPEEVHDKKDAYEQFQDDAIYNRYKLLADVPLAQFFIPKVEENEEYFITDFEYFELLRGKKALVDNKKVVEAREIAQEKRFFHWFLEFPDVFLTEEVKESIRQAESQLVHHSSHLFSQPAELAVKEETHQKKPGGFDCIIGNPPFLGGSRISSIFGNEFYGLLKHLFVPAGGRADYVTYFFRRAFSIIRPRGFLSLIATNTVSQGESREGGLHIICDKGGKINHAVRSKRWPGKAAVEISLISVYKGEWKKDYYLDTKTVERITSYLDDSEPLAPPQKLKSNKNNSFEGSKLNGKGFILESEYAATLLQQNPSLSAVLFPYLNGADLNGRPDQSPSRWVINFHDWPLRRYTHEEWDELANKEQEDILKRVAQGKSLVCAPPEYEKQVAADYPECLEIVEREVKPERMKLRNNSIGLKRKKYWWQYGSTSSTLYRTIADMERVMVHTRVTKTHAFVQCLPNLVFSDATTVFALEKFSEYVSLQSSFHEHWAWNHSSTMKGDRRYSPTNAFETFSFPSLNPTQEQRLESIGKQYHEHRHHLTRSLQWGLTKAYNLFHHSKLIPISHLNNQNGSSHHWPTKEDAHQLAQHLSSLSQTELLSQYGKEISSLAEHLEDIQDTTFDHIAAATLTEAIFAIWELRRLHVEMDLAVLSAYEWDVENPIKLNHGFHEIEYLPEQDRIRFTISNEARKEILKRLLLLNHERYEAEIEQGLQKIN